MTAPAASQARALLAAGRAQDGARILGQALAADPADAELHCLLAQAGLALDRPGDALRAAEAALALGFEAEWPHRLRSIALGRMRRRGEAVGAAREAVRLAPNEPLPLRALGGALLDALKVDEAAGVAAHLAEVAPDAPGSHDLLGRVALRRHRGAEAEAHLRRALTLTPDDPFLHNNLGVALSQQRGRKKDAIDAFNQAARLDPGNTLARGNLKRAIGGYAGVGAGAVLVLKMLGIAQLTRLAAGGGQAVLPTAAAVGVFGAGYLWYRHRRFRTLDPSLQRFHALERWRFDRSPARHLLERWTAYRSRSRHLP